MAAQTASKSPAVLQSEAEIRVRPINGFIGAETPDAAKKDAKEAKA